MMDYTRVPVDYMADGVKHYIEHGIPPGSFLLALFSNNLKDAFGCADDNNTREMRMWVIFMVNEMPHNSQGSPETVQAWINAHLNKE